MSREVRLTEEVTGVLFESVTEKGVLIVNTTPHPITMQSPDEELVIVPTSVLINARAEEYAVNDLFVRTAFIGTNDGIETIQKIKEAYKTTGEEAKLIIVGSIIAAQAYPGEVVGMTPVPGYERVAPAEKRMSCSKFTIF